VTSLYLASKSPRRKQILEQMGITDIRLLAAGRSQLTAYEGDETQGDGERAEDYVIRTSRIKAMQAFARIRSEALPSAPVLAADTIVVLDDEVMGKPADEQEASSMLHKLSGRTHQVITGVTLTTKERQQSFSVLTDVTFKQLSDEEIDYYITHYHPMDKAGAYGIQEWIGYIGVTGLSGSYFNVMGLPVQRIYEALKTYGVSPVGGTQRR
jgi:septum formation protein